MLQLVYLIIAYKNADQVVRLVARLNTPNTRFLIHIDKKADDSYFGSLRRAFESYLNCIFIERESVYWGAWGLVQATLNGIKYIQDNALPCDFLIHMSGQDYPLQSNERIQEFLLANEGKQFIEVFSLPYSYWNNGGMPRVELYYFYWRGRYFIYPPRSESVPRMMRALLPFLPFKTRTVPGGYRLHGGSAAIILARNGIACIDQFVRSTLGRKMVRFFRRTRHPDELFFQTVLMNSPLRGTVVNDDLRYIDWSLGGAHPKVLTTVDYHAMKASGKLIARKFDPSVDVDILDMLDATA